MFDWIFDHPIIVSGTIFVFFGILAIVSSTKSSAALKEGKVPDKTWANIGLVSYVVLAIMTFIFLAWACSGNNFSCFPIFLFWR